MSNHSHLVSNIQSQIEQLNGRKVLIVGDVGLDEYIIGEVKKISPEAPVPVVEVKSQEARLGLSCNVATNVTALGGEALLVGVVGQDRSSDRLASLLEEMGISSSSLIVDESRPTTQKTRIMAEHQQVVRVDFEKKKYISKEIEEALLARIEKVISKVDVVVLQDYAKGVLSEPVCQSVIALAHKFNKTVMVDPYRSTPIHYYKGANILKPNRDEAVLLAKAPTNEIFEHKDFIQEVGANLLRVGEIESVILTQGKEGMSIFGKGGPASLPTYAREVFDVTGAGDTVIAALALGVAAGWALDQSCVLANFAAGVVVGHMGCVSCSQKELLSYIKVVNESK